MASSNVDIPEPRHIPPELIYHIIRELVLLDPEGCLKLSEHEQHTHGTGSGRSPSSWLAVTSFNIEVVQELRRAALVSKAWAQACAPLLWRTVTVDADTSRYSPARAKLLQQIIRRHRTHIIAFEINYPHFINKQNSSPRVTRDLRAALDTLPSLKCMQIAGTRPALSNLLSNQPTLASSLTVLHVADLGDPMSKPAKDPADLAFLDFIKTANNLKTLVMTAIQPLEHASEREQWWRAVLAPRSHKLALSLTNPHPIPTSLTSSPQEMATSVRDEKASLHHLHLHFSRREGDFNQLAQIKARCNDFADLTHLGLSGYTSPPSQAVLQPDFMPHLKELTIDTMPPMISESDKNCMRQWLRTWKPAVLKISAWPDVPLDVLTSILTHPDTSAIKHVHCYRGAWQIFATLDAWLQFKNSLEAAPSARQVTADSGFEHILTQPEFDASSDFEAPSPASSATFVLDSDAEE